MNESGSLDRPLLGDRHMAAVYVSRHPDQIRRRCRPVGVDAKGTPMYDLAEVQAAFANVARRARTDRSA